MHPWITALSYLHIQAAG